MDDVVLMMAEGNFVAAQGLCLLKDGLAAIPGAKETRNLAFVCAGVEIGLNDMQRDAAQLTELFQIARGSVIVDVAHPDVESLDCEPGLPDAHALG